MIKNLIGIFIFTIILPNISLGQTKKKRPDSIKRYSSSMLVGVNGTIRNTWFTNKNFKSFGDRMAQQPSFGIATGISGCWYISNLFGIGINPMFGTMSMKFTGQDSIQGKNFTYESNTKFSGFDFPMYAKVMTESGAYFELGAQYGIISAVKYNSVGQHPSLTREVNTTFMWNSSYVAPIIGGGFDMYLAENIILNGGFRFAYGIGAMRGHDGRPFDEKVNPSEGPFKLYQPPYDTSLKTRVWWVGVTVGVIYRFDI